MNDNEIIAKYKKYEPFFGSWYIKRFIGEGGFAKVFEITRSDFGNEYTSALKIITLSKTKTEIDSMRNEGMSEEEIRGNLRGIVEDTVREIQLMYQLRGNGNIVGYEDHAVIEHEDGLGWDILIKMEFLTSLGDHIRKQNGQMKKSEVIKLGADICKALESCQKYNIIHRDIKADNIFVSENGDFKLGDFGIARVIERKDMELSKKGTSSYMAPEVYKGQTYTSAVDIYSLGMVLYRMLNNNREPFLPAYPQPVNLNDRDQALMMRMSGEKFPKPSQAEQGRLMEIVMKACAYRPTDRYSSPFSMRQELESILLDKEDTTNDELIRIYQDQGEESSQNGGAAIYNEDGATEVLREETTDNQNAPMQNTSIPAGGAGAGTTAADETAVKILCRKCKNAIGRDVAFCPICGTSQREEPQEQEKGIKPLLSKLRSKKVAIIGGASAAVLLLAVVIGIVVANSSSENKIEASEESEEVVAASEPTSTPEPVVLSDSTVLMTLGLGDNDGIPEQDDLFLTTDIPRNKIATVTFVDSLAQMPEKAWDVSEDENKKVMAWAEQRDDEYCDLYIGAEGGVEAHENLSSLFANMVNVEQIRMGGNFHTDNAVDASCLFAQCYALETLDLRGFNTSNMTKMSNMFYGCSLVGVDMRDFDTSKVTDMNNMFADCYLLTDVDLRGFNTSNVTRMNGMFQGCRSLVTVDVSSFDTSNVTDMSLMFYDCRSLTSLDISGFDASKVTSTLNMFSGCLKLNGLDLHNFDSSLVETMDYRGTEAGTITLQGYTFSEAYRQEFDDFAEWGWHETFIHKDDPGRITHILYMNPADERLAEAAFIWDGPPMDAGYRVEAGGMVLTLYGEVDGSNVYRMRFLTMDGRNGSLKNVSEESVMNIFNATSSESVVIQDDEAGYGIMYLVSNSWTDNEDTALIYVSQDFASGVIFMIEYAVKPNMFEMDRDVDLLFDLRLVDLPEFGIDKITGFLGE